MRIAPNRLVEKIRIYRQACPGDDKKCLFDDPFEKAAVLDQYSGYNRRPKGFILAEGTATAQEDRANVHRNTPKAKLDPVSFFNMYFIVRRLRYSCAEALDTDFGSISPEDRVYLLRMKESPNFKYRHTIVYWHEFSRGGIQIFTADGREGHRTSATISS